MRPDLILQRNLRSVAEKKKKLIQKDDTQPRKDKTPLQWQQDPKNSPHTQKKHHYNEKKGKGGKND